MRVTEQIDALEVLATNPVHYLVVPRVWATTLTLPLLIQMLNEDYNTVGAFTAAGLLGAMALVTLLLKTVLEWRQSSKLNAAEETLT